MKESTIKPRQCPHCNSMHTPDSNRQKFCNNRCRYESKRGKAVPGGFERGREPINKVPVGTVKIRTRKTRNCRRAFVKVAEPNVWELRARIVWEAANGPIPPRMCIHHINHDQLDDRLENLEMVTVADHAREHCHDEGRYEKTAAKLKKRYEDKEKRNCVMCGVEFDAIVTHTTCACAKCRTNRKKYAPFKPDRKVKRLMPQR